MVCGRSEGVGGVRVYVVCVCVGGVRVCGEGLHNCSFILS